MKPRSIVFDLYGDYIRYRGDEARLQSLLTLLELFGVGQSTTRVVMARLRKEGWFDTRAGTDGRESIYALNQRSWRLLDEGRDRIFGRIDEPWDGKWSMVLYSVPEAERPLREQLRKDLSWLGFGPLAPSTWIAPHDLLEAVEVKFAGEGVRLELLTCRSKGLPHDRDMAERCWDLKGLNSDYAAFLDRYRPRMPLYGSGHLTPAEALIARMELIHDYRKFPFRDPNLPRELQPAGWLGVQAYRLFINARQALESGSESLADELIGPRISHWAPPSPVSAAWS
jgi:phenylacetic acid degradation operon negative regulatory protein